MYVIVYLVLLVSVGSSAQNVTDLLKGVATYKDCFTSKDPLTCLKQRALIALNETIMDDRPIVVGFLEIQKNPDYFAEKNNSEILPQEGSQRSIMLNDALAQKIQEFFMSRTVRVNLSNAFEARKKGGGGGIGGGGGGGGKGKGMMMAVAGMAAVAINMMMGKMMVMAGSAMMMSKIALLLCIIMLVKKMQEKGGGEEKHVVYADSGNGGGGGYGGGGGGGWHRSISDPQNLVYKQWAQAASSTENGSGKPVKPGSRCMELLYKLNQLK